MIYLTKICRFIAKSHPDFLSCIIFFCQIAKLLTPISALCISLKHPKLCQVKITQNTVLTMNGPPKSKFAWNLTILISSCTRVMLMNMIIIGVAKILRDIGARLFWQGQQKLFCVPSLRNNKKQKKKAQYREYIFWH